jgi:C1A family cysteine protease
MSKELELRTIKWYGWKPDLPDHRDLKFTSERVSLPIHSVSLFTKYNTPPVYDQGNLGSCHSRDTEVLTDKGWKLFSDVSTEDKLASIDPQTSKMIFELPIRLVKLPFKGQLVCSNRRGLNFKVTPDHKMLVRKWNEDKRALEDTFEMVAAKDLGWYVGLMNRVIWEGDSVETFQLSAIPNAKREDLNRSHYTSSQRLAQDLQQLIFMSGDESGVSIREPRTSTMTDGRKVIGKHKEYRVSVCENKNLSIDKKEDIFYEDYDDYVYCAEVPTYHTLVTKRENAILISGNCTANAIAGLVEFYLMNKSSTPNPSATLYTPSRLFIYYYERFIEGSVDWDSGAQLRDGIKVLATYGVSDETQWPYDINQFTVQPSSGAIAEGTKFEAITYQSIDNTDKGLLIAALDAGHPIAFGFTVYESFESQVVTDTGIVPMPRPGEAVLGGHAVCIWGYDLSTDTFLCRNSWGKDWGKQGYFHIPAAYITDENMASDFWIITNMKTP